MQPVPTSEPTADGADSTDDPAATAADSVVFFWRPGCGFCSSLRAGLRRAGISLTEVDIWDDPRAAATVRSITGGNETVPTVAVGSAALVNPSTAQVLALLADEAPHLLPG